ncbi:MAG: NAD-binding protein [Rhodothermales bacterium]
MKFVGVQLSYFLRDKSVQRNVRELLKYVAFITAVIVVFSVMFHFIMLYEGEQHSWITGFYWTLITMSTLGFGDIVFHSDLGRLFTIVVLLSGIVLLLIVLPFAFIRFFYAPWLESQVHQRAPRAVPPGTNGHVIICAYDSIAPVLIRRLQQEEIPYFVLEEDPAIAANRALSGISVVTGEIDNPATYRALGLDRARMVIANREDTVNTNIILTLREVEPNQPIIAIANQEESVDVLGLVGATDVLPLKRRLGEQLANRVTAVRAQLQAIGQYENLLIAELPTHNTPLAGKTIRQTRLRQALGVNIIGVWERGHLLSASPDRLLTSASVLVVIGTSDQLAGLDDLLMIYNLNPNPVVVIGGGRVGSAVVRALVQREIPVNLLEREAILCQRLERDCNGVFAGNAADYTLLKEAGIMEAPSVVLTTHDDAMNIYLASYCRKLNPDLRIVSRITHERNLEAIHRAGADFVLSYASLGAQAVFSTLKGQELVVLGEGVSLFSIPLPRSLYEKTLAETEIGARTGLTVIALQRDGALITHLNASTELAPADELVLLGDANQRKEFTALYT